jgi:hypothetical protein
LEQAGHLAELVPPQIIRVTNGNARLQFLLPRQAVSLLVLSWP